MGTVQALAKCYMALDHDVHKATVYLTPKLVVSLCRRHKYHKRNTREDLVAKCRAAGEPFPVKKVQLKFWPASKKAI